MVAVLVDVPRITAPRVAGAGGQPARLQPGRPSPAVLRQRRIVALGLLAAVLLGSFIGLQAVLGRTGGGPLAATGAPSGFQAASARIWVVRPGDTLWSIAEAMEPRADVRPLVDRLAAEVHGAVVYPGERIAIPTS